jgi:hypothetical protein
MHFSRPEMTIEFGPKRLIQSKVCDLLEHYTFVKDCVILLQRTDADCAFEMVRKLVQPQTLFLL